MTTRPGAGLATATSAGLVMLAGDLSGTANAPTVPGLRTKAAHLVYQSGSGWPTRSVGVAGGYVRWVDPTGAAPQPSEALAGDQIVVASLLNYTRAR